MRRIALIGAGSSVGRYLLSKSDEGFLGVYRSERALSQLCDLGIGPRLLKVTDTAALITAIRGCDSVVTLINDENPFSALASLHQTVEACASAGVPQLIHLSSASIYGNNAHKAHDADSKGAVLSWSSYAAGKQWQENFLKHKSDTLPSIVVLRPGLIWGPNMAWLHAPAGEVLRGEAWIAEGDAPCNLVHIRFVAHAILHFAERRPPGLNFCNLYDRERLTWSEYYRRIAHHLGAKNCDIHVVPRHVIPLWLRSHRAARYVFPFGLAWSVSPQHLKNVVKAVVRSLPRPRTSTSISLDSTNKPHLVVNREVWELKTAQGIPPSNELLDELYSSYRYTADDHWADVEDLRQWMWV